MDFHRVIKEDECGRAVEELEARLRKRSGKGGGVYPSDAFPEQNALFLGPCVPRFFINHEIIADQLSSKGLIDLYDLFMPLGWPQERICENQNTTSLFSMVVPRSCRAYEPFLS